MLRVVADAGVEQTEGGLLRGVVLGQIIIAECLHLDACVETEWETILAGDVRGDLRNEADGFAVEADVVDGIKVAVVFGVGVAETTGEFPASRRPRGELQFGTHHRGAFGILQIRLRRICAVEAIDLIVVRVGVERGDVRGVTLLSPVGLEADLVIPTARRVELRLRRTVVGRVEAAALVAAADAGITEHVLVEVERRANLRQQPRGTEVGVIHTECVLKWPGRKSEECRTRAGNRFAPVDRADVVVQPQSAHEIKLLGQRPCRLAKRGVGLPFALRQRAKGRGRPGDEVRRDGDRRKFVAARIRIHCCIGKEKSAEPLDLLFIVRRLHAELLRPCLHCGPREAVTKLERREIKILQQVLLPVTMRRDGRELDLVSVVADAQRLAERISVVVAINVPLHPEHPGIGNKRGEQRRRIIRRDEAVAELFTRQRQRNFRTLARRPAQHRAAAQRLAAVGVRAEESVFHKPILR